MTNNKAYFTSYHYNGNILGHGYHINCEEIGFWRYYDEDGLLCVIVYFLK